MSFEKVQGNVRSIKNSEIGIIRKIKKIMLNWLMKITIIRVNYVIYK